MPVKVSRLQTNRNITQGDLNPVGLIAESMLTEVQFQMLNGPDWVLADGRSVAGSQYAMVTGSPNIPDLRGQFLRGKNNGRMDGNQDPDGERALGNWQADQMGQHAHPPLNSTLFAVETLNNGVSKYEGAAGTSSTPREATTGMVGGNENRPKNMVVNIFIKVN